MSGQEMLALTSLLLPCTKPCVVCKRTGPLLLPPLQGGQPGNIVSPSLAPSILDLARSLLCQATDAITRAVRVLQSDATGQAFIMLVSCWAPTCGCPASASATCMFHFEACNALLGPACPAWQCFAPSNNSPVAPSPERHGVQFTCRVQPCMQFRTPPAQPSSRS
jgi:hypothetical protein